MKGWIVFTRVILCAWYHIQMKYGGDRELGGGIARGGIIWPFLFLLFILQNKFDNKIEMETPKKKVVHFCWNYNTCSAIGDKEYIAPRVIFEV